MRAVIAVIGKDMVGILAGVSTLCTEVNVNITEVTPSVMQDLFAMIMLVDISGCTIPFTELSDRMESLGAKMGLSVKIMHEDIFNSMHRV